MENEVSTNPSPATLITIKVPFEIKATTKEKAIIIAKFLNTIYQELKEEEIVFAQQAIDKHPELKKQMLVMVRNTKRMEEFMNSFAGKWMAWFFGLSNDKPQKKKKEQPENTEPTDKQEPETPKKRTKVLGIF